MTFLDFRVPAGGFDSPLALWQASHDRGMRAAQVLLRLAEHWAIEGPGEAARVTALDVRRYFEEAAPRHHQDEDADLFPRLRQRAAAAAGEVEAMRALDRLAGEHVPLEAMWSEARGVLDHCVTQPPHSDHPAVLGRFVSAFVAHHDSENQIVLPAAQRLLPPRDLQAIGHAMAQRRGTTWQALGRSGPRKSSKQLPS